MKELTGKVVVVTGASRGLGLTIARGLSSAGATVSAWSRQQIDEPGVDHVAVCDVRRRHDVEVAVASTVDRFGHIDVLIANAGRRSELQSPIDVAADLVEDIVETNLYGTFWSMQSVARQMVVQGSGGKIVAVSSVRAVRGAPMGAAYAASKSAIEGLVRSMAIALGPHDIQVNAVRPGWMATDMTRELRADPDAASAFLSQVPARRFGDPAELVGVIRYLSSEASSFHTGDVLTVDGGLSAGSGVDGTQLFEPVGRRDQ